MSVVGVYTILYVADMERATNFYRDAFGADVPFTSPEWTSLVLAGANIGLHGGRPDTEVRDSGLGIDTDDIEAAVAAVVTAGGSVVLPPEERPGEPILLAKIVDPEGNQVSVSQDKPRPEHA